MTKQEATVQTYDDNNESELRTSVYLLGMYRKWADLELAAIRARVPSCGNPPIHPSPQEA